MPWLALALACSGTACGRGFQESLRPSPNAEPYATQLDEPCDLGRVAGGQVEPGASVQVISRRKKRWEASLGGEEAARPFVRVRVRRLPGRLIVDRRELPASRDALLRRIAKDTWHGVESMVDRENGLPIDHLHFTDEPPDGDGTRVGDYANVSTIGLHLVAIVAARELGWISEAAAVATVNRVLTTLEQLETHAGFYFNYYDTTSLERTSNFISFVDSSWLTAGLIVVRASLPSLAEASNRILGRQDYRFFYDEKLGRMTHGYYVHLRERSRFHYGVLYAESRLGSLLAIGKGDVPEDHWFRMVRTFPRACSWQSQPPRDRERRRVREHSFFGGYYEWRGIRFLPSWGGSMFEALMPTLLIDEIHLAPKGLGANDLAHAMIQRRYATEQLGYPVWGLSPAVSPATQDYAEYGVRPLGSLGYEGGAVTPHAAALALVATPTEAVQNLRELVARYDLYGEFGLYDSVDPASGRVARSYLSLDQTMSFVALANHLCDGCIQRRFASDPIVRNAIATLTDEDFFASPHSTSTDPPPAPSLQSTQGAS